MNNLFENHAAVTLLAALFVTANCQGEPREWTSPFGRWTTPSTTSTTKGHHIEQNRPAFSVCDDKCCECLHNKIRVECTSSSSCKVITRYFSHWIFTIGLTAWGGPGINFESEQSSTKRSQNSHYYRVSSVKGDQGQPKLFTEPAIANHRAG